VIDGIGGSGLGSSAFDVGPGCMTASPPGRIFPANASRKDFDRMSSLVVLTEAIDHMTRNIAMSSVIMSA
jgi:hypothetical protein